MDSLVENWTGKWKKSYSTFVEDKLEIIELFQRIFIY